MVSTATISVTSVNTTTEVIHHLVNATSEACASRYEHKIPSIAGKCQNHSWIYKQTNPTDR